MQSLLKAHGSPLLQKSGKNIVATEPAGDAAAAFAATLVGLIAPPRMLPGTVPNAPAGALAQAPKAVTADVADDPSASKRALLTRAAAASPKTLGKNPVARAGETAAENDPPDVVLPPAGETVAASPAAPSTDAPAARIHVVETSRPLASVEGNSPALPSRRGVASQPSEPTLAREVAPAERVPTDAPAEATPAGIADANPESALLAMLARLGVSVPAAPSSAVSNPKVANIGVPSRDSAGSPPPAGLGPLRARVVPAVDRMTEALGAPVVATPVTAEADPVPIRLGQPSADSLPAASARKLSDPRDGGLAVVDSDTRKTARGPQDMPHPTTQTVALEPNGRLPLSEHLPAAVARMMASPPSPAGERRHVVEVRLDPPSLGTIQVRLEERAGEVHARFVVPNERVERMVNAELSRLHETLGQQGVSLGSTSVETGAQGGGQSRDQSHAAPRVAAMRGSAMDEPLTSPALPPLAPAATGRLNVRI